MGVIANLKIALPPYDEQNAINAFLIEECKKIDSMLEVNDKTIDKLNEYRTALITATVTGKIDVRNIEVPERY
jgi:restriction endonuclease S subunit